MNSSPEFAHLWLPGLAGLELFQAHLRCHIFDKHFHDAYTIGLNERGWGQSWYRGTLVNSPPGSFNLINPGEVHTGQAAGAQGWGFRNLYISLPLMKLLLAQLGSTRADLPCFRGPVVDARLLRSRFLQLFQVLNQPAPLLAQQSLLIDFLSQLWQQHGEFAPACPTATAAKAVIIARRYLEDHYTENVTIATLSQLTGLSGYYLIHCFRQQLGLPPHHYQRQVRLLKAKQALHTPLSLAAIATNSGFYDQSHLTRSFKRVFGVTPGQYRRSNSVQDG